MKSLSLFAALVCSSLCLCLSSCQDDEATLVYLAEADGMEGGAAFTIMFKGKPYERTPIFALNQFSRYASFLNPDGSYGVVLEADPKYKSRLYSATASRQGKHVLPVMNRLAFEPMVITKPIEDGKMVIWNGLNGYDLRLLANSLDPVDSEIEEKRFLDEDPRPRPKLKSSKDQGRDVSGRVISEIPFMDETESDD